MSSLLLVVAKAPVAGQAKTRLCPPATPRQAATVAAAALLDTLAAVRATPSVAPVLAYAGRLAEAERSAEIHAALDGWAVVGQHGDGFAERLARAHLDAAALLPGRPVLQIGMDTPQVTPELLGASLHRLAVADAVLGPAEDGGWWALGLRDPRHAAALRGVPMSTPDTGRLTRLALTAQGLRVADLPTLSDVDTWAAATAVAGGLPGSRFAAAVDAVGASPRSSERPGGPADRGGAGGGFEGVHAAPPGGGGPYWLVGTDGQRTSLPLHRWHGTPEPAARDVIDRCAGPTVDVGCGPGRMTAALAGRGVAALGIDTSAAAVAMTRRRGGSALRRDVFDPLPGEGRWSHVLLMDGNIGIGGDPEALLRRCAGLLSPGGTILVELDAPGAGPWHGQAHLAYGHDDRAPRGGPLFRWARLGVAAIHRLAATAGLTVRSVFHSGQRWFAEVARP